MRRLVFLPALAALACGKASPVVTTQTAPATDAGQACCVSSADAGLDAGNLTVPDAGSQTTPDAGSAVTPDAGSVTAPDAGSQPLPDAGELAPDAGATADAGSDAGPVVCPEQAGALIVYAIPAPATLDWSSPNNLLTSVAASYTAGEGLVLLGDAVMTHEIGHVNVELDCGDGGFPLTGQTGGGEEWQSGADGAGVLFRDFPGSMNEFSDPIGDNPDTVADIQAREASGNVTLIRFLVNQQMCTRLQSFHDQYNAVQAYLNYDGLDRARRFEGAGCAIYGAGVVDVGGLLRRSLFTPIWAQTLFVGSARFANTLGSNPFYTYGSNTVARDANGVDWLWPAGVNLPAPTTSPLVPGDSTLDSWTGPEDTPFSIPGVTLQGPMATAVPFTLYDPSLMQQWAEQVWALANTQGSVSSLQATWTADMVQSAHEITYDATCVAPQTIPFASDNDDLFMDSDAP